ncbi:hypothetical protein BJX76DRAFT_353842 [Aspergillus varians]
MSNRAERPTEDIYKGENDYPPNTGYLYEPGSWGFTMGGPARREEAGFDDPLEPPVSKTSNQQLDQDEREAMDRQRMMAGEGTRLHRAKPRDAPRYNEGPIEGDMPDEALETRQSSTM